MGSIEEDIKNIKELIKGAKDYGEYEGNKYYKSMEKLLYDYTRQKQINEEHKRINGELRERVKELEENNKTQIMSPYYVKENYIPKQVVIDKIEENKQILDKTNDGNLRERLYIENGIMKELLGGKSK